MASECDCGKGHGKRAAGTGGSKYGGITSVDAGLVRWTTTGTELVARECLWPLMTARVFCGSTECRIKFRKVVFFYMLYVCCSTPGVPSLGRIVGDKKAFGQFIGRFKLINELS
jgi:hypothetical protein